MNFPAAGVLHGAESRLQYIVRGFGWTLKVTFSVQLSNTEALSAYVFGSKARLGSLPVARSFDSEVIGETAGRMQSIVSEHQAWLSSNCDRQVSNYRCGRHVLPHAFPGP